MNVCILFLERNINVAISVKFNHLKIRFSYDYLRVNDNELSVAHLQNLAIKYH